VDSNTLLVILLLQHFIRERNILWTRENCFSVLPKLGVCQRHRTETNYHFERERL